MKNYAERWGRFFVKMMARTDKLKLTPVKSGRYMSDVVKAYMMGLEAGYMHGINDKNSSEGKVHSVDNLNLGGLE